MKGGTEMKYDIEKFNPCSEAVRFYNSCQTSEEAWNTCPRGDWMLWIAQKIGVDLQTVTLAKALCANTVRHLMTDRRSKDALLVAIKFGRGRATINELSDAYIAAHDAAYAACAAAAHDAAYAACAAAAAAYDAAYDAADAAYAAAAAAYDAAFAADAAYAAAFAADAAYAAAYAAKKRNQLKTANICRKILTEKVFEIIKKEATEL